MSNFGFASWTPAGVKNNYGIKPISVLGFFAVGQNQQSGSASYKVPAGFVMDVLQVCSGETYTQTRRTVTVSGGNITIGAAADSNFGANTYPAIAGFIIAFVRAA